MVIVSRALILMGSNRLPFGLMSAEYSCRKQYEWQHLTLCQATREQPHIGANLNYPVDAPIRTERGSTSVDSVCDYAKGADGRIHATVGRCKDFPFNRGSSSQARYYQEDMYLPTYFPGGHFSEIDEAKHRAYMESFHTKSKPDHTSAGQFCHRDEVSKPLTKKKPFDELHTIDPGRLELPPSKDFHCDLDVSQNCWNACPGKMSLTKQARQSFQKNSTNRACGSRHGRNSRQKRYGDQLAGEKAKKHMTCKEQKPPLHHEVHLGGSDVTRNDNWEGNAETASEVGHNGAKGMFHPTNIPTAATCLGPKKSNENSEHSSKSIASSNKPKQSEGSSNEKLGSDKRLSVVGCTRKLESEKWPSVVGCTKNLQEERTGEFSTHKPQNLPVARMEKIVHTGKSNDNSPSELLRECLQIWRRRRLRKASDAEAEKLVRTDQTVIVRHGRSATSGSSESDDENTNASEISPLSSERADENEVELENSEKCGSATSPDGVQKHGQGRAKRNSEQSFRCPSGSNCKKNSQNRMGKQGLICNLEVPPALVPNPCEIRQQKEQKELPRRLLSTAHQDTMRQTSQNSCSDTSKIQTSLNICSDSSKGDQAAASRPGSSAYQKVPQHREIHDRLVDARRKYKLGVCCEINEKAEGDGVCEQMACLITDPTILDQESVAVCSPRDGNVMVYGSDCSNQGIETTPSFSASKLDKGTKINCEKKPVNWSSGSGCRDVQNCSKAGDCGDIQQDTMNCKTDKQVASSLAEPENNICKKRTIEDHQPHQVVEVTSNQQTSQKYVAEGTSGVARPADRTSVFVMPDLNCLPSMISDEEFESSEEVINQATWHISKPQDPSHALSAFSETAVQEAQLKEPEKNEFVGGISGKEVANVSRISESHSGPPKLTTVEESSTSTHAFKFALGEFVKNILRPLWEDGLLSRDVHKIIVKKAVEKVTVTLGRKVPRTQAAICRFLAEEESQSVEKLVQGYLDVYLGKQVLKRNMRGST